MQIDIKEYEDVPVVGIQGEVSGKTAPMLQEQVLPLLFEHHAIVLDLSKVTYLSSAGLRVLLLLQRQSRSRRTTSVNRSTVQLQRHSPVALVGISSQVRVALQVTGFERLFVIADSLDEAIGRLRGEVTQ